MPSPRELLEPFLSQRALLVSASTVLSDGFYLKRFFEFLELVDVNEVGAIELKTLHAYRHHLETVPGEKGNLAHGGYFYRSLLVPKLFLRWACYEGHTLVDVEGFPLPHCSQAEVLVPTVDQVQRLLECPDPGTPSGSRDRLLLEVYYSLALRRRESHRLDQQDVNLSRRTLRVQGKGERERLMPLSDRLRGDFARYLREVRPALRPHPDEQALWVSPQSGKRLSYRSLQAIVTRYAKKAGLPEIHPHLLRHSCATHMLEAGAELSEIQAFLGHRSIASSERYTHVDSEQLQAVFLASHPRGRA